jgi:hypothetical protein
MKYLLTESRLENIIQKYLDKYEGEYRVMKRIWVDYDEIMNAYNINLFYDWEAAKEEGPLFDLLLNNQIRELTEDLNGFFSGLKFSFYYHIEK